MKIQNPHIQSGRSMIEMLGVLAIIGVLSIGGIAGYSKAMTKYRVNKTADQITQLAQNIRTLYASQKKYNTLNSTVIKKAHLAPEEMYDNTNSIYMYNPFGGTVGVWPSGKMWNNDQKAFAVHVSGIPQEACVELLTQDWGSGSSSGLIALGNWGADSSATYSYCDASSFGYQCAKSGVMPVNKAISICAYKTDNYLIWKFY